MIMVDKFDSSRRDFLKKLWLIAWLTVVFGTWWKMLYDVLSDDNNQDRKEKTEIVEVDIDSIKDKPIHLWYKQIVKDKDLDPINFPENKFNMISRIARCLRWKPITDAVEDRYEIPRWLLMAMMAQEWLWDPTMPNLWWDWWLWLIHIQAINAHDFWLKTLKRYNTWVVDTKHWKLINETLRKYKYSIPKLLEHDDRFHPVMAVDCAARFLVNCKNRAWSGTDDRIHALRYYSWRWYSGKWWYGYKVIEYRATINNITWDWFPQNFSKNIFQDIQDCKNKNSKIKDKLNNLEFMIDGEKAWYSEYLAYFEESMQNFELQKYMKIWTYKDNIADKDKKITIPEEKEITPQNTLIKSEFVDTKQHNSEWFRLYRYKTKKWDTPLSISDRFDDRDKQNWDKYANTGNLNIVKFNWEVVKSIKGWDLVYVKVRKK